MRTRPVLISIGVHGAILAAIVWTTSGQKQQDIGFFGDAPPDSVGGIGGLRGLAADVPAPPPGPSLSPGDANDYVGQYSVATPRKPNVEMLVSYVHDGDNYESLLVHEGSLYPYKLVPVARDTFVHQMVHARRFVFVRRDTVVVGIELHYLGATRRGVKIITR